MKRPAPFEKLDLVAGSSRLTLVPAAGGAIAAWRIDATPLFRETVVAPAPGWDPLTLASFPLVPYSNRIGGGRFVYGGRTYQLPRNRTGFAHPLHGIGWLKAWHVAEFGDRHAVLRLDHPGDADWPWAFSAEQSFALTALGLTVDLAVTNRSVDPAPLSIGLHPYFDADGAKLQFRARQIWRADADQLPVDAVAPDGASDFAAGRAVAETSLDNGYDGWDGQAAIWWEDRSLGLSIASDLRCAVVYTPRHTGFFCFEPVAHSIDALNLGGAGQAMPIVAPSQTWRARVAFAAWERG